MIVVLANRILLVPLNSSSERIIYSGAPPDTSIFCNSRLGILEPILGIIAAFPNTWRSALVLWLVPFIAFSILVLFVLSLLVVEYQEQRVKQFDGARRLRP